MPEIEQVKPEAEAISANLALEQLISECIDDPEVFFRVVLRQKLRKWQKIACRRIKEKISENSGNPGYVLKIVIRTTHGAGKSFFVAGLTMWFTSCRPESRGLTTAPRFELVEGVIWAEINRLYANSLLAEIGHGRCLTTELEFGPGWRAFGTASDKPTKMEGQHSPVGVIRVVDEAKAVERGVFVSTDGMLDAPLNLDIWISTPSIRDGILYERDVKNARDDDGIVRIKVSNDDLIRDAEEEGDLAFASIRRNYAKESLEKYGSTDDPEYQTRVMAEYADFDANALFPYSWISRAMASVWADFDYKYRPASGVDCAGSINGDATVKVDVYGPDAKGRYVAELGGKWRQADTMKTKGNVVASVINAEKKPYRMRVDTAGLGKGIHDALKHDDALKMVRIESYLTLRKANDSLRFKNRKTEDAYFLRRLLEEDKIRLYESDDLKSDLVRARTDMLPSGQVRLLDPDVEDSKGAKSEQGTRSPDDLDALLIAISQGEPYSPTAEERIAEALPPLPDTWPSEADKMAVLNGRYHFAQKKLAELKTQDRTKGFPFRRKIA